MSERWVVIPNWDKFQHYKDRDPVWIKLYLELRSRDEWRQLSLSARGLLVCLWVEYAASNGLLRTSDIPGRVAQKVHRRTFDSLLEAGLVVVSSRRPLALARARALAREEKEKEPPKPPAERGALESIPKKELRRFTGCRWVRGSHGASYIPDPLGTDRPPDNWPYERPSRREVELALEAASPPTPTEAASHLQEGA